MDIVLVKDALSELSEMIKKINIVNSIAENLGCVDGTIIGTGRSDYTQGSTMYNLSIGNKGFALIDIPGIEGDESAFEDIIKQSLEHAHVIFYVNGSGKKIEQESLQKIKKYMHDGTSVWAIFNTHCKAKKERIPGIDKDYSEELKEAYSKQESIVRQTEEELVSFLGSNYKGSISLNGLLGFCSLAFDDKNNTSIRIENDKNLCRDQEKYLKEYLGNRNQMLEDSHISLLTRIIENKIDSYESDIIDENLKKLKNRMNEMLAKVTILKNREVRKIDGFINIYNEFESNCYNAKEDFIRTMRHVAYNAAMDSFYDLMNELFDRIERDGGKSKSKDIQSIVSSRKDDIVAGIEKSINEKIERAQETFKEAIEDAKERLIKDFDREQVQFEISLSSDSVALDNAFTDALNYNLKDFGKHAFTVGSLALSGAGVGSLICPGLGTAIGAGIGAVLGILSSIWNYFASEKKRINNAKLKIQQAIDEQIDEISEQINEKLRSLSYEDRINEVYESLCESIELQKKNLMEIRRMICNVENEMSVVYKNIA